MAFWMSETNRSCLELAAIFKSRLSSSDQSLGTCHMQLPMSTIVLLSRIFVTAPQLHLANASVKPARSNSSGIFQVLGKIMGVRTLPLLNAHSNVTLNIEQSTSSGRSHIACYQTAG